MAIDNYIERLNARARARSQGLTFRTEARDRALPSHQAAIATDAAFAYYGAALSPNIARTDEGYLICKDAVLGRTGRMQYLAGQLNRDQLGDLGLSNRFQSGELVDVWREPEELFSPATLASFEGKPVTDNHPDRFVSTKNYSDHCCGHVQNVRAGKTPLTTGDLPLLGDIHITNDSLAEEVLSRRKRQLSCGYGYHLAYDGERLTQVGILGNHVAVVSRGRAGAEAQINDDAVDDVVARLNHRARRRSAGFND